MKAIRILLLCALVVTAFACSDSGNEEPSGGNVTPGGTSTGTTGSSTGFITDLMSFDITVDSTALAESETVDTDDEDYLENNDFDTEVKIVYNGTSALVEGAVSGVSVETDGAHVTVTSTVKGICYTLSGSATDGSFKIYSGKKFELKLNGVSITNPTGAAINSQSGKRCYVELADGTYNTLTDGTTYDIPDGEDMKATLFSEGELLFSGTGHLKVYANYKGGITSDDYILFRPGVNIYVKNTAGNAIKANDVIYLRGGVINVECSGTAAKGMKSEGHIYIDGGRFTAITTGGGEVSTSTVNGKSVTDASGSAGIKCDSLFVMTGGTVNVKSTGAGGKGISGDMAMTFAGGTVNVVTTGNRYTSGSYATSPKGIKGDANITLSGANVKVRAMGNTNSEGIESKATLTISDGTIAIYAYDDAINASSNITITGGSVYAFAPNDDGIDSNGTLTIKGGTVVACGTGTPEDGFDCDQNTFTITGGTLLGIGGGSSSPTSSATTQPVVLVGGGSISAGTYVALADNDGNNVYAFYLPWGYSSYTVLASSPKLTKGGKCTLTTGASVSGGTTTYGFVTGASVSGGSTLASLTLSNIVTTSNYSSMGGGGTGGGNPGSGGGGFGH